MPIMPGHYNVFEEDGTLFKWGSERVFAKVTMENRVQIFIGDNMEPRTERYIPSHIHTVKDFDKYTLSICRTALVKYAELLVEKLRHFQEAYQIILEIRKGNQSAMYTGAIPAWLWLERLQDVNELQEICEESLKDTMSKLYDVAPKTGIIIVFTEH